MTLENNMKCNESDTHLSQKSVDVIRICRHEGPDSVIKETQAQRELKQLFLEQREELQQLEHKLSIMGKIIKTQDKLEKFKKELKVRYNANLQQFAELLTNEKNQELKFSKDFMDDLQQEIWRRGADCYKKPIVQDERPPIDQNVWDKLKEAQGNHKASFQHLKEILTSEASPNTQFFWSTAQGMLQQAMSYRDELKENIDKATEYVENIQKEIQKEIAAKKDFNERWKKLTGNIPLLKNQDTDTENRKNMIMKYEEDIKSYNYKLRSMDDFISEWNENWKNLMETSYDYNKEESESRKDERLYRVEYLKEFKQGVPDKEKIIKQIENMNESKKMLEFEIGITGLTLESMSISQEKTNRLNKERIKVEKAINDRNIAHNKLKKINNEHLIKNEKTSLLLDELKLDPKQLKYELQQATWKESSYYEQLQQVGQQDLLSKQKTLEELIKMNKENQEKLQKMENENVALEENMKKIAKKISDKKKLLKQYISHSQQKSFIDKNINIIRNYVDKKIMEQLDKDKTTIQEIEKFLEEQQLGNTELAQYRLKKENTPLKWLQQNIDMLSREVGLKERELREKFQKKYEACGSSGPTLELDELFAGEQSSSIEKISDFHEKLKEIMHRSESGSLHILEQQSKSNNKFDDEKFNQLVQQPREAGKYLAQYYRKFIEPIRETKSLISLFQEIGKFYTNTKEHLELEIKKHLETSKYLLEKDLLEKDLLEKDINAYKTESFQIKEQKQNLRKDIINLKNSISIKKQKINKLESEINNTEKSKEDIKSKHSYYKIRLEKLQELEKLQIRLQSIDLSKNKAQQELDEAVRKVDKTENELNEAMENGKEKEKSYSIYVQSGLNMVIKALQQQKRDRSQ